MAGPKPFRAFRDALRRWPESAEAWRERQREAAGWRVAEVALAFDAVVEDPVIADMIARLRASDADAASGDADADRGGVDSTLVADGDPTAGRRGVALAGVARLAVADMSLGRRGAE